MAEGNTLFMLGSGKAFTEDETEDSFGLMPYLSEDGTKNNFILNVSRYTGINKALEQNPQKLEDALHIMEVMSTVDGMNVLNGTQGNTALLPLKDYAVSPDGYYADVETQLNSGATAPFIYNGWENIVVPFGEKMLSFIMGKVGISDIAETFDQNQYLLSDNADVSFTTAAEKIDNDHCAKLVGIVFAKASGADMALISKNKWYNVEHDLLNSDGVSGTLPVTEQEITSILPTGWRGNIQTLKLSGAKEEQGGGLADMGVLGLDAMKEYLKNFDAISEKDIVWSKEQE